MIEDWTWSSPVLEMRLANGLRARYTTAIAEVAARAIDAWVRTRERNFRATGISIPRATYEPDAVELLGALHLVQRDRDWPPMNAEPVLVRLALRDQESLAFAMFAFGSEAHAFGSGARLDLTPDTAWRYVFGKR